MGARDGPVAVALDLAGIGSAALFACRSRCFTGIETGVPRNNAVYRAVEAVIGRSFAWRLGRFLYLGARRELSNEPNYNGEYALIGWVLDAVDSRRSEDVPTSAPAFETKLFFDVGANRGDWTAALADRLGQRGLTGRAIIHSFEPAPAQRAALIARHSALIDIGILYVHAIALGAAPGRTRFLVTGEDTGTSAIATAASLLNGDEIEVEVSSLDELSEIVGQMDVFLVKIDTEGNDFNVIAGAAAMLDEERIKVIQFEYNWRWIGFGHWLQSVFRFVENRNYVVGLLTQQGIEVHSHWHPELDRYTETNYVLVHRDFLHRLPHWSMTFDDSNVPVIARRPHFSPPRRQTAKPELEPFC